MATNTTTTARAIPSPVLAYLPWMSRQLYLACCFAIRMSDSFMLQGKPDLNLLAMKIHVAAEFYDVPVRQLARKVIKAYMSHLAGELPPRQQILDEFAKGISLDCSARAKRAQVEVSEEDSSELSLEESLQRAATAQHGCAYVHRERHLDATYPCTDTHGASTRPVTNSEPMHQRIVRAASSPYTATTCCTCAAKTHFNNNAAHVQRS